MGTFTSFSPPKTPLTSTFSSSSVPQAKVVLLGNPGVGKSSILLRFNKNVFFEDHGITIGVDYSKQTLILKDNMALTLHFWEMEGGERFRAIVPNMYYRDANAAVLVYDVGISESFQKMKYWINELDSVIKSENIILLMAGNKCDLPENEKKISSSTAKTFAEENRLTFFEASAKNGNGIQELFQRLAEEIYKKMNKK